MKNRKAKMLISRVYSRCYPSQWLIVSNRRMVLYLYSGIAREGIKDKPSAAQNRWKNHLRTKGEWCAYIIQKRISAKKQSSRISVSHSVYRVDDTDIPANFCLDNRKNN
ncbi:hypothetical protein A311_01309 [Escherichia coli KTE146]|nr:hypothetical protein A311_01309 [Escherichia coli KTE146]